MGNNATAILAFGVDTGDECPYDNNDGEFCFDDFLGKHAGLKDPLDELPPEIRNGYGSEAEEAYDQWILDHPGFKERQSAFWQAQRDLEAAAPIHIIQYGSGEYPHHIVALKHDGIKSNAGTYKNQIGASADWGEVTELGSKALNGSYMSFGFPGSGFISDSVIEKTSAWCAERNIPFEKPQWLLAAYYG